MNNQKKELLAASFEELLTYIPFEDITVQNIVDNCQTSRTTFYRCFQDKYEIMDWIYQREADIFFSQFSYDSTIEFISSITKYFYSKKNYFSRIFKYSGQNSFVDFFIKYSIDVCKKRFTAIFGDDVPKEIMDSSKIYVPGVAYFYMHWALDGFKESPEDVTEIIYQTIPEPIKKYL